jgi:hypothetical protein
MRPRGFPPLQSDVPVLTSGEVGAPLNEGCISLIRTRDNSAMAEKNYRTILAKYQFKDKFGHSLELVTDYQDLLAELDRLREAERERGQISASRERGRPVKLETLPSWKLASREE